MGRDPAGALSLACGGAMCDDGTVDKGSGRRWRQPESRSPQGSVLMLDMRPSENGWSGGGGRFPRRMPLPRPARPGDREWLLFTSGGVILGWLALKAIRSVVGRRPVKRRPK
jgi:hypothetical protein